MTYHAASPKHARNQAAALGGFFHCADQEMSDEADLSTEQSGACPAPRLSRADGDGGRPQRVARAPRPRPQETVGLITLTRRADFVAANGGKRAPTPGFVLLTRDRADGDPAMRVGYTVTKKIGGAVVRNRLKRRLRALARELMPSAGLAGHDHVLIGRHDGVARDFALLRTELARALARVAR